MEYFVEESKYHSETISIVVSFSDVLSPGDSITGLPSITVTVFTGIDATPTDILYLGISIIAGTSIEQRIRLGVIGVIYHLLFTVTTVQGDTLQKECYVGILPEDGMAIPTWLPFWASTQLYPYQISDNLTGQITFTGGRIFNAFYAMGPEYVKSSVLFVGGILSNASITYNNPHEDIKGQLVIIGGTLQNASITYSIPHEDIKTGFAIIGGTLQNASITYHIPHEDLKGTIQIMGGTLV